MLKRFASKNGGSKDVEAVIAKARFFVTAAIAEIGFTWSAAISMWQTSYLETDNCGVGHGPLCCPSDAVIQASFVCVVAAVGVSEEQCVDTAQVEQFGEIYPVVQLPFCG